jgi:hypothetical protein
VAKQLDADLIHLDFAQLSWLLNQVFLNRLAMASATFGHPLDNNLSTRMTVSTAVRSR